MPRYLMFWLALAMFSAPVHAQPVFRSGVDLVHFGVTVVGRDGRVVSGLTAEDFVIEEEGREQEVAYFARGLDSDLETMPLHLGVLFDTSGSMERDAGFAKTAAVKFLRSLDFATDMTLVGFDTEVRVSRFGQADFPRLVERLRSQETGGMTALYDALGVYLDGASAQDGRKVLLLYSDGGDTRSRMRLDELLDLVRASDVTVYAIGFQTQTRTADRMLDRRRLEEIVGLSGGRCYFPDSMDELDEIYAQIRSELAARYSLGYISTDPNHRWGLAPRDDTLCRPAAGARGRPYPRPRGLLRAVGRGRTKQPAVKATLHSTGAASRLTALLLGQILPVFSLVAPCQPGASPVSVRRVVAPRTARGR